MHHHAATMLELFSGHTGIFGTYKELEPTEGKRSIMTTARTVRGQVNPELWDHHLTGVAPLGIIPSNDQNKSCWGVIDVDDYVNDHTATVERVEARKLPLIPCRSKSGGLHLFLFLTNPTSTSAIRHTLLGWAKDLGLDNAEVFPKAPGGNWVLMPYFGLDKRVGLYKTGKEMTIDEFVTAALAARTQLV